METVIVDGGPLTPEQVVAVAFGRSEAVAVDDLDARLAPARRVVDESVASDQVVYGITTGFGALATTHIGKSEAEALQYNLLRSHATGVGEPIADEVVRAMLLLRARTLSQGHSGVRPVVVRKLLELLQRDLLPVVPSQGSVGASGDLAPFAHLALPLIGEGKVVRVESSSSCVVCAPPPFARSIAIDDRARMTIFSSTPPSISLRFRPCAKSLAAWVYTPEVTTNPPAAPRAAITP